MDAVNVCDRQDQASSSDRSAYPNLFMGLGFVGSGLLSHLDYHSQMDSCYHCWSFGRGRDGTARQRSFTAIP